MDLKAYFILLILIVLGVYLGSMWTHKMIKAEAEREEYRRWVEAQQNPPTTATV